MLPTDCLGFKTRVGTLGDIQMAAAADDAPGSALVPHLIFIQGLRRVDGLEHIIRKATFLKILVAKATGCLFCRRRDE